MASFSALRAEVLNREEKRRHYETHLMGLNAYERHKQFMKDYVLHYVKSFGEAQQRRPMKTDQDTLRETYRFIRTEEDDSDSSWEQRLAKRYYDKLFKEYCIADMAHYKNGKASLYAVIRSVMPRMTFPAMRHVLVNFTYIEAGDSKQALVKLRVCPRCAEKLNYRRNRDREKLAKQQEKAEKRLSPGEKPSKHQDSPTSSKKRRRTQDMLQESSSDEVDAMPSAGHFNSPPPLFKGGKMAQPRGSSEEEDDKYFKGMFL